MPPSPTPPPPTPPPLSPNDSLPVPPLPPPDATFSSITFIVVLAEAADSFTFGRLSTYVSNLARYLRVATREIEVTISSASLELTAIIKTSEVTSVASKLESLVANQEQAWVAQALGEGMTSFNVVSASFSQAPTSPPPPSPPPSPPPPTGSDEDSVPQDQEMGISKDDSTPSTGAMVAIIGGSVLGLLLLFYCIYASGMMRQNKAERDVQATPVGSALISSTASSTSSETAREKDNSVTKPAEGDLVEVQARRSDHDVQRPSQMNLGGSQVEQV